MIYDMNRILNTVYPKACMDRPTVVEKISTRLYYNIIWTTMPGYDSGRNDSNVTSSKGPLR